MEVHSVKNSKQFSDLDSMPKISINTNTTIPNQSIDSVHDSSTRHDRSKNEKKTMVRLLAAWNNYQVLLFSYNLILNTFFRNFSRERMANRLLTLPECTSSTLYICVLFDLLNWRISAVGWTIGRGNICRKRGS